MGSYISLGFVFKNDKDVNNLLKRFIDLLNSDRSPITYKVCFDVSDDHWIEKTVCYDDIRENEIYQLTHYSFSSMTFKSTFLGFNDLFLTITHCKQESYFGFMVDLFEDYFKISYLDLEELIIDWMEDVFFKLKFDYAFAEHDGEIEFSPDEVLEEEINYSLLFLSLNRGILQIKKGDHLLDGLTIR